MEYMNIKFRNIGPKRSIEEIADFEKENNVCIPEDYKEFLMQVNGGNSSHIIYKLNINDICKEFYIAYFLHLLKEGESLPGISLAFALACAEGYYPDYYIPIATTLGGDSYLLSCRENKPGIFYYKHDMLCSDVILFGISDLSCNPIYLCDSFNDFISRLEIDPLDLEEDEIEMIVKSENENKLLELLDNGFDPNFRPREIDFSLIELVSRKGILSMLKLLLDRDADPRNSNAGILHGAVQNKRDGLNITKHLLDIGFDVNEINEKGYTPLSYAKSPIIRQFLIDVGAKE